MYAFDVKDAAVNGKIIGTTCLVVVRPHMDELDWIKLQQKACIAITHPRNVDRIILRYSLLLNFT